MDNQVNTQNSGGAPVMDEKVEGFLIYFFGWIGGLIFLLVEKNSKLMKFHSIQSISLDVVIVIAYIIVSILAAIVHILAFLSIIIYLAAIVIKILMIVKAVKLEAFKLPVIGDFAEQQANK